MGLKSLLLSAKRKLEKVQVPELGMDVWLRRLNGNERDAYQEALFKADEESKSKGPAAMLPLQRLLLSMCVCDEQGEQAFSDPQEVGELDGVVIERLSLQAMRLNCFTRESAEAIEKKASPGTSGSGTT